MDDKHYKKLMRRFTIMWFLVLGLLLVILLSVQNSTSQEMRRYVDTEIQESRQQIVDNLPEPIPGKDGRDGVDGKNGQDGVTTIMEHQTTTVVTEPGEPGPAGEKGEQGERGRELQIQFDPETGDLETKYEGDDFWQVLIPCTALTVGCNQ